MLRTISTALGCATIGAVSALGVIHAFDNDPRVAPVSRDSGTVVGTTFRALTVEEIDVLAEGEDSNRRWEVCQINTDFAVSCPDGTWHEMPVPLTDGSTHDLHAFDDMLDLDVCTDGAKRPCRVDMDPTYVVGGDGTVHDDCTIVLVNGESSEMICRDDTVWPS